MALTLLMAAVLLIAFALMFGLVRFTETVIEGPALSIDEGLAAKAGAKPESP